MEDAEPAKKSVSYFFSEDIGVYASVEAMLLKPHILKCAKRSAGDYTCLLYTSPSPRDGLLSRMPSSA